MPGPVREVAWRLVLPEIRKIVKEELESQLKPIYTEIKRLDEKVDSMRNELKADIARVDEKLSSRIQAVEEKVSSFARQTDLVKEVERLKIEVSSLKERK